jgi:hypothetical protein
MLSQNLPTPNSPHPQTNNRRPMKRKKQITFSNFDFDRPNSTDYPPRLSTQATHSDTNMQIGPPGSNLCVSNLGSGYRCCKCTHGVETGSWWWQAKIDPQAKGHFRIGWSQILEEFHAPVGFDEYSYAWRSVDGAIYHCSRPVSYSKPWGPGDVIGCRIDIPEFPNFSEWAASSKEHQEMLEEKQKIWPALKEGVYDVKMDILPGSSITFYLNGESMEVAFRDLYRAKYYPAVSIWQGGPIWVDFEGSGPDSDVLPVSAYKKMNEVARTSENPSSSLMNENEASQRNDMNISDNEALVSGNDEIKINVDSQEAKESFNHNHLKSSVNEEQQEIQFNEADNACFDSHAKY